MDERRNGWVILGGLTGLKCVLFVGLASVGVVRPFVGSNAADLYIPIADRVLAEHRFNGPDTRSASKVPPGYPVALAIDKYVSPAHWDLAAVVTQMIADLVVAVCLFTLAGLLTRPSIALAAGVAWILFPPAVVMSTWITAESEFTALLVVSITLLILSVKRHALWGSVIAGGILGCATLFRGTTVYLPVFLLPFWALVPVQRRFLHGVNLLLGSLIILVPWTVRNWVVLHDRIVVAVGIGSVVLQGSDPQFFTIAGKEAHYPDTFQEAAAAGLTKPTDGKESSIDNWLLRVGVRKLRTRAESRPLSFIPFLGDKFLRLWYASESGGWRGQLALGFWSLLLLPLAIAQLWRWRDEQRMLAVPVGATLLYFTLLHWVTLPLYRYMLPIYPFLVLAAVVWLGNRKNLFRSVPAPIPKPERQDQ